MYLRSWPMPSRVHHNVAGIPFEETSHISRMISNNSNLYLVSKEEEDGKGKYILNVQQIVFIFRPPHLCPSVPAQKHGSSSEIGYWARNRSADGGGKEVGNTLPLVALAPASLTSVSLTGL